MSDPHDNGLPGTPGTSPRVSAEIIPVIVPELDAERTAGTLVIWHCEEGEAVSAGAALLDIEADTISTLSAPATGTLRRRLAAAGDMLQEGALVAVLAGDTVDDARIDEFVIGFATPDIPPEIPAASEQTPAQDDNPDEIVSALAPEPADLPAERSEPATARESEAEGEAYSEQAMSPDEEPEEALETGIRPPRDDEGARGDAAAASPGDQISNPDADTPLAAEGSITVAGDETEQAEEPPQTEQTHEEEEAGEADEQPTVIRKAGGPAPPLEERDPLVASEASMPVSPLARRLAEKLGVDIESVTGTGRNGRVTRRDVELAAGIVDTDEEEGVEPDASAEEVSEQAGAVYENPYESEEVSDAVRTSAQDLAVRQAIPHTILNAEAHVGDLSNARVKLIMETGGDVPLDALLVRAAALALRKVPRINANLVDNEIRVFTHADVSVAVPTGSGMQAPVIRAAETKTVEEIAKELEDFTERAQQDGLTSEDVSGGTFGLVSLASSGVTQFEPAINPPQVATLALGAPLEQVVVREGNPKITSVMRMALCCDLRALDLGIGAQYLKALTEILESPGQLLEE